MIKWHIKYTDYDGVQREEDFYFGLNKAEIIEMNFSKDGGYEKYLRRIVDEQDARSLLAEFKHLICISYGVKSDDGKRFVKSKELTDQFLQTEAYAELFTELANNTDSITRFVNGILPDEVRKKAEEASRNGSVLPMATA